MSIINNFMLAGDEGYNIQRSLRFRSSASSYLNRTPASAGNRKTWTYSTWLKRGAVGAEGTIISGGATTGRLCVYINSSGQLVSDVGGTGTFDQSTAVYRDPSAWYHFVWQFDTTQATGANRSRMYINGVQVTLTNTRTFTQNADYEINNSVLQTLGTFSNSIGTYSFDGYQTETNFIDGQALTPSSFGETDVLTGVWKPKKYAGTYGTNGFYLPFTDVATTSGSNAGLGKDFSGNGNYWNTNNISVTAGSTYDSMSDVPTLTSATASNYCVLNPLSSGSYNTISNANLKVAGNTATNNGNTRATINFTTGKWYIEMTAGATSASTYPSSGIIPASNAGVPDNGGTNQVGYPANSVSYEISGNKRIANSTSAYGSTYTTGDVIGIAIDADNGAIYFSKNGTFQNSGVPTSGSSKTGSAFNWTGGSINYAFATAQYNGSDASFNFGQQPFTYTPPTGFVALNTFNLPEPSIKAGNKHFDATTYSGNGTSQTITNASGFAPDFVWIKGRNYADNHTLWNTVVGAQKSLSSDTTTAETTRANALTAFASNGFTLGTDTIVNYSAGTYVGWQWKANGTGSSNTAGSITSTVSANPTAGFSVVTYTGTGVAATVGHGLGVAPSMLIIKSRVNAYNWVVYNSSIGNTKKLYLDLTDGAVTDSTAWNNTSATSSVFSLGSNVGVNQSSSNYVAYCFSEVAGFSKFGSYTGNGSADGTFVHLGFRPKYFMVKRTDAVANWVVFDTSRDSYNVSGLELFPNTSDAENNNKPEIDLLSNGVKLRWTYNGSNASSGNYIYMAFAENPFKYSLAR